MTIWVGHDGTLNDDEGDGPAVAGDPMEPLVGFYGYGSYGGYPGIYPGYFHGYGMPYEYVGQDDFSSALGSIGSALGTAFGGSGGAGGGAGGGGGFDFGSLASSFGSALGQAGDAGGGGDTGAAIANIFGQVAKVAVPAATQAIAKAAQSQQQAPARPQPQPQAPAATTTAPPTQRPAATAPAGRPAQPRVRAKHPMDPKARANLVLSHLGKQYGMTPPAGAKGAAGDSDKTTLADVGSFVQNMMGGPKTTAAPAATTGDYVGDLGDLLGDLESSIVHPFLRRPVSHGVPRVPFGLGINIPFGRAQTYPAYSVPRQLPYRVDQGYQPSYPYYQDQGYAQPQGPYMQQGMYAPPRTTRAPVQTRPPVTYQPYPMPQPQAARADAGQKKWSSWAMEVGPITVTHPDEQKMIQVSAEAPRRGVGKFVSKMMGGPGAHPAMRPDEDLRRVQRTLNQYYATRVLVEDGLMGDETHRILRWFQKSNGLPETGNPDPAVTAVLDKLLADRAVSQGLQPAGDAGAVADSSDWWTKNFPGHDVTGWTGWG